MIIELDEHLFPPFEGFPKEGIDFLRKLKKNNNREWFTKHKQEYEEDVKFPMQCLIESLKPHFADFAPLFDVNPKRAMFRIYRDTRFSKDKTPYKTHVSAHFELKTKPKLFDGAGYYVHIAPGEVFLGGGIYMPANDQLKKIRKAIADHSKEFLSIVNNSQFKKLFGTMQGNRLTRIPQGFTPDHPLAEYLKLKQFFVGVEWKEELCYKKNFIKKSTEAFKASTPLIDFLNEAMNS
jgi:uncharacterized protein (TIGR02453 family)